MDSKKSLELALAFQSPSGLRKLLESVRAEDLHSLDKYRVQAKAEAALDLSMSERHDIRLTQARHQVLNEIRREYRQLLGLPPHLPEDSLYKISIGQEWSNSLMQSYSRLSAHFKTTGKPLPTSGLEKIHIHPLSLSAEEARAIYWLDAHAASVDTLRSRIGLGHCAFDTLVGTDGPYIAFSCLGPGWWRQKACPRNAYVGARARNRDDVRKRNPFREVRCHECGEEYAIARQAQEAEVKRQNVERELERAKRKLAAELEPETKGDVEGRYTVTTSRLHELKNMPYSEYLQSPEWIQTASAAKERAGHRCQVCYSSSALNAHHRTYQRLGREGPSDITVLCHDCHSLFHTNGKLQRT